MVLVALVYLLSLASTSGQNQIWFIYKQMSCPNKIKNMHDKHQAF